MTRYWFLLLLTCFISCESGNKTSELIQSPAYKVINFQIERHILENKSFQERIQQIVELDGNRANDLKVYKKAVNLNNLGVDLCISLDSLLNEVLLSEETLKIDSVRLSSVHALVDSLNNWEYWRDKKIISLNGYEFLSTDKQYLIISPSNKIEFIWGILNLKIQVLKFVNEGFKFVGGMFGGEGCSYGDPIFIKYDLAALKDGYIDVIVARNVSKYDIEKVTLSDSIPFSFRGFSFPVTFDSTNTGKLCRKELKGEVFLKNLYQDTTISFTSEYWVKKPINHQK